MIHRQYDGPCTLAALARTARFFQDVALDTLWNIQSSLIPLVKCFPQDVWTERRDEDGFRVVVRSGLHFANNHLMISLFQSLVAEPKPEDWTRVKLYAARIRDISLSASALNSQRLEGKLAGDAFVTLKKSLGSEPFLPNLHSFAWEQTPGEEAHALASFQLMLSPHASSMNVKINKWSDDSAQAIATALDEYGEKAVQLRSITVLYTNPNWKCPPIEKAVLALGFRQQNLQALMCTWQNKMSLETITQLSKLNTLQKVSIKADAEKTTQLLGVARSTSGTFFSSLRLLSLHSDTLALCEEWLHAIRSSALDSLTCIVDEPPTTAELHGFLTRLAASSHRLHSGKLAQLRLVSRKAAPRPSSLHHVTPATLEPLLPLALTALQLEPGCPVDVDDAFLERAARAWPRLRTLELAAELRRYTGAPRVTLAGLLPLAQHCPDLSTLGLPFVADAGAFQQRFDAGDRPTDGVSFGLEVPFTLGVGGSIINQATDTFLLAGVLSDLCPSLRAVQTAWNRLGEVGGANVGRLELEREDMADSWRQIDRFAVEMARVRRQERMWLE